MQDELSAALSKYCVPKCTSDCLGTFQAEYDKATDTCKCAGEGIFVYDDRKRECILNCPSGSRYVANAACVNSLKKYKVDLISKQEEGKNE